MKLSTKIAHNTIIQIISKIFSTALVLFAMAIITRKLGQTGFGEYTTIITFVSFFAIAADLGLTLITVQMISRPDADEEYILGNLFGLRLVTALIFLGLAPLIVLLFPYSQEIKTGVLISSFIFLFITLNQVLVGLFQKKLRMDKVALAEIISKLFLIIGIIIALQLNTGLFGVLVATALSSLVSFLLHFAFARKFVLIKLCFDFHFWKKIFILSWPLALTITLNLIYLKTDTLLLSIIERPSKIGIIAEVGLYGVAYKVIDVLITFPFMFAGIVLPVLTRLWVIQDKNKFKITLQRSFDLMAIIAIPITIGTQFVAKDVMTLVAGPEFKEAGNILQILILTITIIFLGNILAHAVIAIEKQKKIIVAYIFTAITSVISYLLIIPHYSYLGAAWVTIYSESCIAIASLYIVWKYTNFLPNSQTLSKSIFASGLMAIFISFSQKHLTNNLFIIILLSIIIYSFFIYLLKAITKNDILNIIKIK